MAAMMKMATATASQVRACVIGGWGKWVESKENEVGVMGEGEKEKKEGLWEEGKKLY